MTVLGMTALGEQRCDDSVGIELWEGRGRSRVKIQM